eukprot:XP_001700089.1 predicted protein [Chlamydomonas reinhardtii]
MGGVADIARHFGLKAVYVLVAWGVTRVLEEGRKRFMRSRRRRSEETGAGTAEAAAAPPPGAGTTAAASGGTPPGRKGGGGGGGRYRLYRRPLAEYTPSNPGWLREAVSYDPAALATDLSWQCPLLIQFLVRGEAGAG